MIRNIQILDVIFKEEGGGGHRFKVLESRKSSSRLNEPILLQGPVVFLFLQQNLIFADQSDVLLAIEKNALLEPPPRMVTEPQTF